MYKLIINGELYHHGVPGQKWGVRKERRKYNKQLKRIDKERSSIYNKSLKEYDSNKDSEAKKINKQISTYENKLKNYKKYNFDKDDGGGGKTKKDRIAGQRYSEYQDKIERLQYDLDNRRNSFATKRANSEIINKYGKQTYDDMIKNRSERADRIAKTFVLTLAGASLTGLGYTILHK